MKIAHQAWRFVVPAAAAGAIGLWLLRRPGAAALGGLLAFLGFGFALFTLYFFRDPERTLPTDPDKIYSPGDGVVMSVAREGPGDVVTLRIFLSVFNVHVQRAPCAGKVTKVQVVEGSFAAAMKDSARYNARVVMTVDPGADRRPLIVEQIAGLIARRIECWPKPGDGLVSGQRYGIIYFGSQAAVHFPAGSRCTVKPGDVMTGALTEIGEWTNT
ncbi:MAG TPA: phosphatidylserine decarboxylase [Elusimicrobiota bacterium]|jgi:phosphatidylserine decarboxylase|nr:phosphatidylserine decarboxylase [Elusimicrobiota bacterium]